MGASDLERYNGEMGAKAFVCCIGYGRDKMTVHFNCKMGCSDRDYYNGYIESSVQGRCNVYRGEANFIRYNGHIGAFILERYNRCLGASKNTTGYIAALILDHYNGYVLAHILESDNVYTGSSVPYRKNGDIRASIIEHSN
jgi:hypothetical protein